MTLTLVAGTWAWKPDQQLERAPWWMPGSAFADMLEAAGHTFAAPVPFIWSTNKDGIFEDRHMDWRAGGANLATYLRPPRCPDKRVPAGEVNLIAHSHGGQVVFYAAADEGLEIDTLITVATPVRADLANVIRRARPRIRRWIHLHSNWKDYVQAGGSLFDGFFGIRRTFELADQNIEVKGVAHSAFLNDPQLFGRWPEWLQAGRIMGAEYRP